MPPESRLLKANLMRNLGSKVAFNYEDLRQQCDDHIARVRLQVEELLTRAHADAQEIRQQALDAATTDGRQSGLREAHEQIESRARELASQLLAEKLRHVLPALESAISGLQIERDRWLSSWEKSAVGLAVAIAEKILRQELETRPEVAIPIIAEALQLAAGQPHVQVSMHPRDIELIQQAGLEMAQRLNTLGEGELVADERISRGGCLIDTRHGVIDARLETQLERIAAELVAGSD